MSYSLSSKAEEDLVTIYKYGLKTFGQKQAESYLLKIEGLMFELAARPEIARDASFLAEGLLFIRYKAHRIFYTLKRKGQIYIVRILGDRMDFNKHI